MAIDIGPKIGIDGEAEFRKSISNINQQLKTLASEMSAVTSAFTDNDSEQEKLMATNRVLAEQIAAQTEKVAKLQEGLDKSTEKLGANDTATLKWRQAVADATAQLNTMQAQLAKNEASLLDSASASGEAADELKETEKATKDAGAAADDAGSRFDGFSAVLKGVGAAAATAATAAGTAAVKLGTEVVQSFGELEQNLGGSEVVFGEWAEEVQKISEDAYKNLGASQSEYLATANKMASLFQGSGIEQGETFELTTQAMQRAADVASVMGIDVSTALESIAGAAKGNFDMMDNLGVAMNATTIEAYALANGIGLEAEANAEAAVDAAKLADAQDKLTKAQLNVEMQQSKLNAAIAKYGENSSQAEQAAINLEKAQVDMSTAARKVEEAMIPAQESLGGWWDSASNAEKAEVAMQMFFERTSQYAGNFARESEETVSGSLTLLQASVESLIAGLGNSSADISNLVGNVADAFTAVTSNVQPVLETLIANIPTAVDSIVAALRDMLPILLDTATALFESVLQALIDLLPELIPFAVDAIMQIVDTIVENLPLIINAALEIILALANGLIEALPQLIPAVVDAVIGIAETLIENIDPIIDAALEIILALADGLLAALPRLVEKIPELTDGIVNGILSNIDDIIQCGVELLVALIQDLPQIIKTIISAAPQIVTSIIDALLDPETLDGIIQAGVDLLTALIIELPTIIELIVVEIPKIITSIIFAILEKTPEIATTGHKLLVSLVEKLPEAAKKIGEKVQELISGIGDKFNDFVDDMTDIGQDLVEGLWQGILDTKDWIIDKVTGLGDWIMGGIKDVFGINSPSKVMADEVGVNLARGIGVGFDDAMPEVARQMQRAIPSPEVAFSNAAAGMVNGVQTAMAGMTMPQSATIVLQTSDGQTLARWLLPDLRAVMRANPEVATV